MNQGIYYWKQPQLDKTFNWINLWNMVLIFILSFIWAAKAFQFLAEYKKDDTRDGAFYAYYKAPEDLGFKVFLTYLLLAN